MLHGEEVDQLFMILTGEGGTGKSHVIHESHNTLNLEMQWIT